MNSFKLLWIPVLLAFVVACSKSNEEEERDDPSNNGGGNNCNTANMRFVTDVVPILQTNCYACHSNANQSVSGISLEGYSNVRVQVDNGHLLGAITHASGFTPMPQGGPKLSDCNISKIKSWIDNGAPNN